jgi:hypothetical protein
MKSRRLALGLVVLAACAGGNKSSSSANGTDDNKDPSTDIDAGQSGDHPIMGDGDDTSSGDGDNGKKDASICESVGVRANQVTPDMLIVLDKSGSMTFPGCDSFTPDDDAWVAFGCDNPQAPYDAPFDRWTPSVQSIKTITSALQTKVKFGLMIFPDDPDFAHQFAGIPNCKAGFMVTKPDLNTATAIAQGLDKQQPDGDSTPTAGTLKAAHDFFGPKSTNPDSPQQIRYVLLVTDGAPNCDSDGNPALSTGNPSEMDCQTQSYAQVDALLKDDVQTYVIGYDTARIPELATVLDELAKRGGTGDTHHRPVEDGASLLQAIESITGAIASCTYKLEMAPGDPSYVRVTLDGTDIAMGDNGWQISNETTIELKGDACKKLQTAGTDDHNLKIQVECAPVVVQ